MQNEANVQNSCRQTLQRHAQTQFVQAQQRTLKEIARVQAELAKKRPLENTAVICCDILSLLVHFHHQERRGTQETDGATRKKRFS